jgi:hypothetical protein
MADKHLPTPEDLRGLLRYEPETGKLFWLERKGDGQSVKRFNSMYAGREALTYLSKGYRIGSVMDADAKAHRVAWAIYYGEWPQGQIDHINGDRADNRIANLRVVDFVGNARNRKAGKNNSSGVIGVGWSSRHRKWRASIRHHGELIYLGAFASKDDAIAARRDAEARLWGAKELVNG